MHILLFVLVTFVGITAFPSGILLIYKPDGHLLQLSTAILTHTPFKNFKIPGLLLALIIGTTNLLATLFFFYNMQWAFLLAFIGGLLLIGWLIVQMILIQTYHKLQDVFLLVGYLIVLISYQLMNKTGFYINSILHF